MDQVQKDPLQNHKSLWGGLVGFAFFKKNLLKLKAIFKNSFKRSFSFF